MGQGSRGKKVEIINAHKRYRLNEPFLKRLVEDILKIIKAPKDAELEFVFLDNNSMGRLNRKYKNREGSTDVLSFKIDRPEVGTNSFLGEVFISLDTARKNSKLFETKFVDELVRYIIHALLHLFGYDDRTRAEKRKMSKKEAGILDILWKRRDLSKVLTPR